MPVGTRVQIQASPGVHLHQGELGTVTKNYVTFVEITLDSGTSNVILGVEDLKIIQ